MGHLAFGEFELDPASGELRKGGNCIRLQEQPLKLLLCLLSHPGQLVTREELQQRIWGGGVHVDFDDGLNAAAWRLRQALGDSTEEPTYIETIPRKGYRFIPKVRPRPGKAPPPPPESCPMPVYRPDSGRVMASAREGESTGGVRRVWLGAGTALAAALLGLWVWPGLKGAVPTLIVPSLHNNTGDPAMDYVAETLTRDVVQELRRVSGLSIRAGGDGPGADSSASPRLEWTILRDGARLRIPLNLVVQNKIVAGEVIVLEPGELGSAGKRIADWTSTQTRKGHS